MHHPWMRTCSSRGTSRTRHANEARAASQSTDACMVRIIGWPLPAVVQPCRICLEVGTATMGARRSRLAANPRRSDRWRVRGRSDRDATRRAGAGGWSARSYSWGREPGREWIRSRRVGFGRPRRPPAARRRRVPLSLCCCRHRSQLPGSSPRAAPACHRARRPLLGKWFSEAGGIEPARNQPRSHRIARQRHDAPPSFVAAFLPCGGRRRVPRWWLWS